MNDSLLLIVTMLLPLAGASSLALLARAGQHVVRASALAFSLATLVGAVWIAVRFAADGQVGSGFGVIDLPWLGSNSILDIRFAIGLDGLGLWLFVLTSLLMITAVLISWEAITSNAALYYAMLLLLEFGCLGVFAARDIILFYVFFEFTLIPLFFLIGIWGSEQRQYAARKFFIFTLAGSVLTFVSLLAIVVWNYQSGGRLTFSIPELTAGLLQHPILPLSWQVAIFLGLFAGFAIKVPLFPLHTWLPLAHVQAPAAGSVFLAGIMLKIGTYGFLRFNIGMLPDATALLMPAMLWLAVAGILYGALVALAQSDVKRLVAYSSVSHLGYCMLGLFALNHVALQGGTLQMINHGISTGALFALIGMLYERYHTREIRQFGGLARRLPRLAFFMLWFTFSSIGLPGMNGFAGEFLILAGMFQRAWGQVAVPATLQLRWISVLAVGGVVLGAWYMLSMVRRMFFGPLREPGDAHTHAVQDLNWRECLALAPLAVMVVWIGIQPGFFLRRMAPSLNGIANPATQTVELNRVAPEPIGSLIAGSNNAAILSQENATRVR